MARGGVPSWLRAAVEQAAFVVVTGLSGAGKSHAIRALEDLGYFCVDNLPVALIPTFADLTLNARRRAAPGGRRRGRARRAGTRPVSVRVPAPEEAVGRPDPPDFPRGGRQRAPSPIQRNAAASSARRGQSDGGRGTRRGAAAAAADSAAWPIGCSTRARSPCTNSDGGFRKRPAAHVSWRRSWSRW